MAMQTGLTSIQARERLRSEGFNEIAAKTSTRFFIELLGQFLNPLALILLVAGIVSAFIESFVSAAIIFAMTLLGGLISSLQNYQYKKAVERLQQQIAPLARVFRDGKLQTLPRREVVVGDILDLHAGDMVSADAVLISGKELHVQESALTGESMPVEKQAGADLFLGSSVVSGFGQAEVKAIGFRTRFGNIAARLAQAPPPTDFDRGMRRFGFLILQTVFALVVAVLLINVLVHRNVMESLLFAVALAVGLTPEFLPMILSVTLSKGVVKMARSGVIVKHLSAMQNFGSIDVLCCDKTGTLTRGEMVVERSVDAKGQSDARVLVLAAKNSATQAGVPNPLDKAILQAESLKGVLPIKIDEIPFDFERRRLSVLINEGIENLLVTKGAPESVLSICKALPSAHETLDFLHRQGLRVIAVATKKMPANENVLSQKMESDMDFCGFVTFIDPPLEEIRQVFEKFAADNVQVKILTGDNELVAMNICQQAGLNVGEVLRGEKIENLSDLEIGPLVEKHRLFARVTPAQKNRIVNALKQRGHVVGFMGDGINDAPSLHDADVGISFLEAADVARETADVILTRRDLRVLHQGIMEGRAAFGNVMKYLLMGTSSNFGNMLSMAVASIVLPFLPMLPVQILLNNFLYDLAQVAIPSDHVDVSLTFKPRSWDISLVRKFMAFIGPLSSIFDFLTFYVFMHVFEYSEVQFHTGWFIESLFTQTLVIFVIRTAGSPFQSRPSKALSACVMGVVAFALVLPFLPFARSLGFESLPFQFFIFLILTTLVYLGLVDIVKRRLMKNIMMKEMGGVAERPI